MVTGSLRPEGARSAGQEAIADASDAHDARMARFSEIDSEGCARTSFGCSKIVPGCSSALVKGGALHFDIVRQVELPFEVPGRDAPV
jgi:hypothetical protein